MTVLDTLTDADLASMTSRAWTEAARDWADYRSYVRDYVRDETAEALLITAEAAETFWRDLMDEADRRLLAAGQPVVIRVDTLGRMAAHDPLEDPASMADIEADDFGRVAAVIRVR